jgi:hypothetical protein
VTKIHVELILRPRVLAAVANWDVSKYDIFYPYFVVIGVYIAHQVLDNNSHGFDSLQ